MTYVPVQDHYTNYTRVTGDTNTVCLSQTVCLAAVSHLRVYPNFTMSTAFTLPLSIYTFLVRLYLLENNIKIDLQEVGWGHGLDSGGGLL
jgi:hypothetical protein